MDKASIISILVIYGTLVLASIIPILALKYCGHIKGLKNWQLILSMLFWPVSLPYFLRRTLITLPDMALRALIAFFFTMPSLFKQFMDWLKKEA